MSKESPIRMIAFYGTLKKNPHLWTQLSIQHDLKYIREIKLEGSLYDLGEYPGLILNTSSNKLITALLYSFSTDSTLAILDDYEGCWAHDQKNSLFVRVPIMQRNLNFWVYFYNKSILPEHKEITEWV